MEIHLTVCLLFLLRILALLQRKPYSHVSRSEWKKQIRVLLERLQGESLIFPTHESKRIPMCL